MLLLFPKLFNEMPENRSSILLTQEENDLVFNLLGHKCVTLATTVVELYTTGAPQSGDWRHKETGVLCLVKDSNKKSYFFRLYCPVRKRLLWEHELYNNLQYIAPTSFLHTFEAENCITGFNFASEDEGSKLRKILLDTLEIRRQRRVERNHKSRTGNSNVVKTSLPSQTNGVSYGSSFIQQSFSKPNRRDGKKKVSKADIGQPTDFRHVSHVGWDPNKGFDLDKADDPQLREFFAQAGVSETHLRDKETREFIYDFIARNGGIEAVKEEMEEMEPPPIPARAPPKPPPLRNLGPPPPPPQRLQPPRPSAPKQEVSEPTFAPPPPPPPPGPPPPPVMEDPKAAVLQELTTKGKQLKPPTVVQEVEERKQPLDSHCQLMDQIRKGVDLKPVSVAPSQNQNSQPTGLAGALARALAERNKVIHSDSSSTSDSDEAFDEWDD